MQMSHKQPLYLNGVPPVRTTGLSNGSHHHQQHQHHQQLQQPHQQLTQQMMQLQEENARLLHQLHQQQHKQQQNQSSSPSSPSLPSSPTSSSSNDPRTRSPSTTDRTQLQEEARRSRVEVERLQDLVLVMGRKHLQAQAQLSFLQQQQSNPSSPIISGPPLTPLTPPGSGSLHGHRTLVSDLSQASLLASIAAVAATSLSKPVATTSNSKNNRRFTVQANNIKEDELTLEQRKCEFLLDQIANLQRGYDTLRQEKSTLEIQLDLMQRQHQYHQQQRQKRRSSQRRTLGHDQSQALSLALTGAANSLPQLNESRTVGHENKLGMIPSTPLTSTFLSPEAQAQEVARIQYELAQAQLREEEEERQVEAQRRAAEEAEREARRLRRQKSMHLKEALASLESKRARSDSGHVQFSSAEDLKHLEQLQLFNQQPQQQLSSQHEESRRPSPSATATPQQLEPKQPLRLQLSPVTLTFQSAAAAAAAAGRKILSPFSPRVETTSSSSSSHSDSAPPLTPLFSPTVSSTSPAVSSPASSSSSSPSLSLILSKSGTATSTANNIKQPAALYTQSNNSRAQTPITTTTIAARSKGRYIPSTHTFSIEQCSCCIGGMIEL